MKWHPNEAALRGEEPYGFYTKGKDGRFTVYNPRKNVRVFLICLAAVLAIGGLLFASSSEAEEPQSLYGLLCTTPDQAEAVIIPDDHLAALALINTPNVVCGRLGYVGIVGETVSSVMAPEGPTDIKHILVLGVFDGQRLVPLPTPKVQYGPFLAVQPAGLQI